MTPIAIASDLVERLDLPDAWTRAGIAWLVARTARHLAGADPRATDRFAEAMAAYPIAAFAEAANAQHYELPPEFFGLVLGPRRKYSCCLYDGAETLAQAELRALEATAGHAMLEDGQDVLELGCGWGSLSLWLAQRHPASRITAVSNSRPQRAYIEAQAASLGLRNLRVLTADMNHFRADGTYDRIVSIEMFEHIANWGALLARAHGWLRPDGRLFLHVFAHRSQPYRFEVGNRADWIAQHFFTGGIMPSHGLIRGFPALFAVEQDWRWDGTHYQRTARDWLANFDRNRPRIDRLMQEVYGARAALWTRRWRLFFLATAGLFGHAGGGEWGVSHYRLRPVADQAARGLAAAAAPAAECARGGEASSAIRPTRIPWWRRAISSP
jgi:cyclopropane-fatty-acyl-phospholipid synthase